MAYNDVRCYVDIIAILVRKLGDEVSITNEELKSPPIATVIRDDISGTIILTTKEK